MLACIKNVAITCFTIFNKLYEEMIKWKLTKKKKKHNVVHLLTVAKVYSR